ncbi:MAG: hypothetical protein SPL96_10960 [Bacteroidales bacterium]|nr:hypothetical protein [Bacteroidales bacterium]
MITIEKEIKYNRFCRPGYHEDAYTDGIQTTVRLFGIPVYRYTNIVKRVDDSTQTDKADKEPVVIYANKHILLCAEDMSSVITIADGGRREPTKWEVLKAAYHLWRHLSKGKGLSRNFFTNALAKFRAAPWKASHASSEKETVMAPEPSASHSDTECRPPHSGQTNSPHSRSIERNT